MHTPTYAEFMDLASGQLEGENDALDYQSTHRAVFVLRCWFGLYPAMRKLRVRHRKCANGLRRLDCRSAPARSQCTSAPAANRRPARHKARSLGPATSIGKSSECESTLRRSC